MADCQRKKKRFLIAKIRIGKNSLILKIKSRIQYKGIEYYKICSGILDEAKQLIQVYDKETDSAEEI